MIPKGVATRELDIRVGTEGPIPGPKMHIIRLGSASSRVILVGLFRPYCRVQSVTGIAGVRRVLVRVS